MRTGVFGHFFWACCSRIARGRSDVVVRAILDDRSIHDDLAATLVVEGKDEVIGNQVRWTLGYACLGFAQLGSLSSRHRSDDY